MQNGVPPDKSERKPEEAAQETSRGGLCTPVDKLLSYFENIFTHFYSENTSLVKLVVIAVLCGGYLAYFMVACIKDFKRARDLFAITMFALFCFFYWLVKKLFGEAINDRVFVPLTNAVKSKWTFVKW